jgi:quinol monooxygenase YgiN
MSIWRLERWLVALSHLEKINGQYSTIEKQEEVHSMVTHVHVGFKVKDYEQWKEGYDASIEQRKAAGEISFQVFRNVDDPNTVTVLSVQESAERVQAFLDSPDLKVRMEAAGITEMGQMLIMEEMDSGTH